MKPKNLTSLPFFSTECGAIVVIRSEDKLTMAKFAMQVALESADELNPTTLAESISPLGQQLLDLYENFKQKVQNYITLNFTRENIHQVHIKLLGEAARQHINQRFIALVCGDLFHEPEDNSWTELRTQINMCGQKIAMNIFDLSKEEGDVSYEYIAEYLLDAHEENGEIVLTPIKYGGEVFPADPIRLAIDPTNEWYPYKVKI